MVPLKQGDQTMVKTDLEKTTILSPLKGSRYQK
jgi:hypothetical protein